MAAIETQSPGNNDIDNTLVINGSIRVRKTHPNLYRMIMLLAVLCLLLGLNFVVLHPTFLIYDQSNYLWGIIFFVIGTSQIVFLNFYPRLKMVRLSMSISVGYFLFLAMGTCQPFFAGVGSLQLPILYGAMAIIHLPLLFEPFINPWTAEREP